ncbi:MAG: hypothetical protein ACUVUE_07390 [Candidatus Bathycorpusculaceae bacterium]
MERFEKAAEEKKRRQTKQEVEIVVEETAEILNAGTQSSKRMAQTS